MDDLDLPLTELEKKVIDYSIRHKMGHIPSALTQVTYLRSCLDGTEGFWRVAGKPFGAQAWYVALEVEDDCPLLQPPYVDWNCQTIGHALGYSLGASGTKHVWLNLSDAALEAGDFWESLQLWHTFNRKTLFVTVDCNGYGCKHGTTRASDLCQRIKAFGVPCRIQVPSDKIEVHNGITLVDTSHTLGAQLKKLGFHYIKFKDLGEFYALYRQRMAEGPQHYSATS